MLCREERRRLLRQIKKPRPVRPERGFLAGKKTLPSDHRQRRALRDAAARRADGRIDLLIGRRRGNAESHRARARRNGHAGRNNGFRRLRARKSNEHGTRRYFVESDRPN